MPSVPPPATATTTTATILRQLAARGLSGRKAVVIDAPQRPALARPVISCYVTSFCFRVSPSFSFSLFSPARHPSANSSSVVCNILFSLSLSPPFFQHTLAPQCSTQLCSPECCDSALHRVVHWEEAHRAPHDATIVSSSSSSLSRKRRRREAIKKK